MPLKETLVVLDFDGLLINSYDLLNKTFSHFGLNVGDKERFQNRKKFLKYIGGGKEFVSNLVNLSLPKKKLIRKQLTETYCNEGIIYPEFTNIINDMIDNPDIHVGIVSRNFTHHPGSTIRKVLQNSKVAENALDFIIPVSVGVKKINVLEGMKASSYKNCIFAGDEISDYRAAYEAGYNNIFMASYGFDTKDRLINKGKISEKNIYDSPKKLAKKMNKFLLKLN